MLRLTATRQRETSDRSSQTPGRQIRLLRMSADQASRRTLPTKLASRQGAAKTSSAADAVTSVREYDPVTGQLVRVFVPERAIGFRRPRGLRFGPCGAGVCIAWGGPRRRLRFRHRALCRCGRAAGPAQRTGAGGGSVSARSSSTRPSSRPGQVDDL